MKTEERGTIVINKKVFIALTVLVVLGAGYFAWQFFKPDPDPKKVIMSYLKKRSGQLQWISPEALRQAQEPWTELAKGLAADNDYFSMYRHIGENLALADKMLASTDRDQRLRGLRVAVEAERGAQHAAEDTWVSARICEAFLVPNLSLADQKPGLVPSRDQLVSVIVSAFQESEEFDGQMRLYKKIIAQESALHEADWARNCLANLLAKYGRNQDALALLKEIQDPASNKKLSKRIAKLEKKVQAQQPASTTSTNTGR